MIACHSYREYLYIVTNSSYATALVNHHNHCIYVCNNQRSFYWIPINSKKSTSKTCVCVKSGLLSNISYRNFFPPLFCDFHFQHLKLLNSYTYWNISCAFKILIAINIDDALKMR